MSDESDQTEQLRGIVGTVLPPADRDAFVQYARLEAFRDDDGQLDTEKVMGHLTAIHAVTQLQQPHRALRPGDAGRLEAARRSGLQVDPAAGASAGAARPGDGGRAEAARRTQNRNQNRKARQ